LLAFINTENTKKPRKTCRSKGWNGFSIIAKRFSERQSRTAFEHWAAESPIPHPMAEILI